MRSGICCIVAVDFRGSGLPSSQCVQSTIRHGLQTCEFLIIMRTAIALGLIITQSLLLRAWRQPSALPASVPNKRRNPDPRPSHGGTTIGESWRIGYLSREGPSNSPYGVEAFREGLRMLGYVEGQNVLIELRFAEGRLEAFPALAEELVRLKVDVIVAPWTPAALAAKESDQLDSHRLRGCFGSGGQWTDR